MGFDKKQSSKNFEKMDGLRQTKKSQKSSKNNNEFFGQHHMTQKNIMAPIEFEAYNRQVLQDINTNFAETAQIKKMGDSPLMSDTLLSSIF